MRRAEPVENCSIGVGKGYTNRNNYNQYALTVFGKPKRETPCDCERSNEPSLLQTVYLRNDQEMFSLIERKGGWLKQIAAGLPGVRLDESDDDGKMLQLAKSQLEKLDARYVETQKKLKDSKSGKKLSEKERSRVQQELARIKEKKADLLKKIADQETTFAARPQAGSMTLSEAVADAYLRTFSRYPSAEELKTGEQYVAESEDKVAGLRDLMWALINSKEFVVNH